MPTQADKKDTARTPQGAKKSLRSQIVSERKRRVRATLILFAIVLTIIGLNLIFDKAGFITYVNLKKEEKTYEQSIAKIEKDIAALKEEIVDIKTDPFQIEKQAREGLGLAKPDEYVFLYNK
ncbi:MAG: septum formation initiator family protein [Candidatus Magnetominusculus sp. LBB02]|nr:septum formation initiator family protein [Candidatus Magnetominusculus sp. LBB02]